VNETDFRHEYLGAVRFLENLYLEMQDPESLKVLVTQAQFLKNYKDVLSLLKEEAKERLFAP